MSSFCISNHCRAWLLSESDYRSLRTHAIQCDAKGVRSLPDIEANGIFSSETITLNLDDILNGEIIYISYCCRFIHESFGPQDQQPKKHRVPLYWRVAATAAVFFQRFYLNNSLKSFNPKIMMCVAN